ncbi:hypothetical protein VSH64_28255 [Amycolatopsis rhabdoformis]|uniref:Secreted protein n=1 Tax=Amycolatopsis rhabdoformis TaxID=1448059 RepID=A0ABZ1HZ39_9PSEU|nr:hypothetical protein [Amycolatopsis rhabdoformis]WSE26771.1 hypothetical protein VSH64_28255 [Amycolatopsis rhabdoformis]
MKTMSKAALGVLAAGAMLAAFPGVGSAATSADGNPAAPLRNGYVSYVSSDGHGCGSTGADWSRYYHHCTNDGRSIQVLARFVLVGNTIACVGPGQTVKVSVTTTYSLDWNGQTCTNPGQQWAA